MNTHTRIHAHTFIIYIYIYDICMCMCVHIRYLIYGAPAAQYSTCDVALGPCRNSQTSVP